MRKDVKIHRKVIRSEIFDEMKFKVVFSSFEEVGDSVDAIKRDKEIVH